MSILQKIVPPIAGDVSNSQAVNLAIAPLCAIAHSHVVYTSSPTATDGANGDIALSSDGTKIYIKQNGKWFKASLTAV